jgi:hypothetical protein
VQRLQVPADGDLEAQGKDESIISDDIGAVATPQLNDGLVTIDMETLDDAFKQFFKWSDFLGSKRSHIVWQIGFQLIVMSSIFFFPYTLMYNQHGTLSEKYLQAHQVTNTSMVSDADKFAADNNIEVLRRLRYGWTICCAMVGMNSCFAQRYQLRSLSHKLKYGYKKASTARSGFYQCFAPWSGFSGSPAGAEGIREGHMLRIIAELDMSNVEATGNLRWWLKYGTWLLMGPAVLMSLQGLAFVEFFWSIRDEQLELLIWLWHYLLVIPSFSFHLAYFVLCIAVANAVVAAHCNCMIMRHEKTGDYSEEDRLDFLMDGLHDVNRNIIPTVTYGWGSPIASTCTLCVFNGLACMYKVLNYRYPSGLIGTKLVDYTESFCLLFFACTLLLLPAMTTTSCNKVRTSQIIVLLMN